MWAAVVVLFVAAGVSDGVILSKCEVKQQLEAALTLPPNATDILAKMVCHVELISNFNTSAINTIPEPENSGKSGQKSSESSNEKSSEQKSSEQKSSEQKSSEQESSEEKSSEEKKSSRRGGKIKGLASKFKPPTPTKKPKVKSKVWTMYGLFQLSDHVACSSTQSRTPNLCGLNCNNLLDDDITDDLECVKVLMAEMTGASDHETVEKIQKMISLFQPQCANADNSYFSDCV